MDDSAPTPPSWLSYRVFAEESRRFASKMETVAFFSRKRIDLLDFERARRAEQIAAELRKLAKSFSLWDSASAEQVALERSIVVPHLASLLREAIAMLESLPTHPTLGPIRFPNK